MKGPAQGQGDGPPSRLFFRSPRPLLSHTKSGAEGVVKAEGHS